MLRHLGKRLLQGLGVLWAAYTLSFIVLYALPGDPVSIMLRGQGESTATTDAAQVAALRAQYGFDKPVLVQYLTRLVAAAHGEFGTSMQSGGPVSSTIGQALPQTAQLALAAITVALVCGVGMALLATYVRRPWLHRLLMSLPPLWSALPTFWIGLVLVQVLSFQLRWFPAIGNSGFASLVLPALTLSVPATAVIAQVLAAALEDAARQPYIDTAVAKGASARRVHLVYAFRNAAIPATTLAGVLVGHLFAGSVVTETVFSRVGVGRLTEQAVRAQDIPMVQGLVLLAALLFVLTSLLVELLYPLLDPRIARAEAVVGEATS